MSSFLVALAILTSSPGDVVDAAYLDLFETTPAGSRPYTRYLWAVNDPEKYQKAVAYAANSTSFRSEFGKPLLIPGGLIKIDLRDYGWDYPSRSLRYAELQRRGATFKINNLRYFLDPWEALAALDPYFRTEQDYYGKHYEGWIDPRSEKAARYLSHSCKFVLRADWVLPKLLQEKDKFGGIYSDLLMFPPKEADLYKSFLIDIKAYERDSQLRQGGSVQESIVALHNRELQLLPSPYGRGAVRYYWQTFDVNVDARGDKSILEALAGTLKHDGRESLGTLPNGLQWYQLFDGAGNQAVVVPEEIAQIKVLQEPIRDSRVINSYACLKCHGPSNGIYAFDDVVRQTLLDRDKFKLQEYDAYSYKYKDSAVEEALRDYYTSSLGATIAAQKSAYAAAILECCGMTGAESAKLVVGVIESYLHDLVSPEGAALEMGLPLASARVTWLASYNPQLFSLAAGHAIRRAAWELSYAEAMYKVTYPWREKKWEKSHVPVRKK